MRLTDARARDRLPDAAVQDKLDDLIDRVSRELDTARGSSGAVRGDARRALVGRLAALDAELISLTLAALDEPRRGALEREADEELAGFRDRMSEDAYRRARVAVVDRIARERFGLPTISF
jgi:hypothetical protein